MNARRKAFTLIELLAVMTVFSAIFGTVMLTLYAMQKTSRGFTDGIATSAQQQRFVNQLRVDAHQARETELKQANPENSHLRSAIFCQGKIWDYPQPHSVQFLPESVRMQAHHELIQSPEV